MVIPYNSNMSKCMITVNIKLMKDWILFNLQLLVGILSWLDLNHFYKRMKTLNMRYFYEHVPYTYVL